MAIPPVDIATLPVPAQRIVAADAQPRMKQMAAKGVVPGLRPEAIVTVLALLTQDTDTAIAGEAAGTLAKLPPPVMTGALAADLDPWVVDRMADSYRSDREVLTKLFAMPRVSIETVEDHAKTGGEPVTELIATNEQRLLDNPQLIAALYMNKATRMSTADRIVELATRNGVSVTGIPAWREVATAVQDELICEPSDEPLPDDELFYEQDALAHEIATDSDGEVFVETEPGKEEVQEKFKSLAARLSDMSVSQRVRRAMLGTKEERMLLVREQNKVVCSAAARSPLMQESDIVMVAKNRNVPEEVLRIIGSSPIWLKSYSVKKSLIENAKTPVALAQSLIPHMREADLKRLMSDKNVSSAIQMAAKRHLQRRDK
ncbi:MAG: hypothetical protein FJ096_10275 [Deltaproteobacteria bacterium]|nr:hypothetical protein [Deltaproteobacteria bacterium]